MCLYLQVAACFTTLLSGAGECYIKMQVLGTFLCDFKIFEAFASSHLILVLFVCFFFVSRLKSNFDEKIRLQPLKNWFSASILANLGSFSA